jgi:hypothetical protein
MALYIHPDNQTMLWDAIQVSELLPRVFPRPEDRAAWFRDGVRQIYQKRAGGKPVPLTPAQVAQLNRDTVGWLLGDLKTRAVRTAEVHRHDENARYKLGIDAVATRFQDTNPNPNPNTPTNPMYMNLGLNAPANTVEARLAEQQRELDFYLGETRPAEIDFRASNADAPIENMEALVKQHLAERMAIAPLPSVGGNCCAIEMPPPPPQTQTQTQTQTQAQQQQQQTAVSETSEVPRQEEESLAVVQQREAHTLLMRAMETLLGRMDKIDTQIERMTTLLTTAFPQYTPEFAVDHDDEDEEYSDDDDIDSDDVLEETEIGITGIAGDQ